MSKRNSSRTSSRAMPSVSDSREQDDPAETEVVTRLKSDISRRLNDVCSELSGADKQAIVDLIARNEARYPEVSDDPMVK
jgi:ABC-type uncharacterized transport system ATPase component